MAPQKRSNNFESENESEDDTDISSSQSSARKRRRKSDNIPSSQISSPDADAERNASTPPSDIDMEREDEELDEDEEEMAATQAIRAKAAAVRDSGNQAAECGILETVELTNFMCHKKMEYKLGPLINFICGKNGSGKSAILTAIVLCLGGKAASTNRGSSLKDFIKEGEDYATIVCKIKNQGDGAYCPEDYGQTIQVERHFSRFGTSGFKVKNARGRVISTKRADLDEICDHFTLQIENPLNVLSQDQARQFIATSSAAEKYKFFVKGVLLEQLDQDYRLIGEQIDNITPKIETKRPDVKILETRWQSAQNKLELSRRYETLLEKLRELRRQLAWSQVIQQEDLRDDYIRQIAEFETKIHDAEADLTAHDEKYQQADQLSTEKATSFEDAKSELDRVVEEKREGRNKQDDAKKEASEAQAEHRSVKSLLDAAVQTIAVKRKEIEAEQTRLTELTGGGAARRLEEHEEARRAMVQAKTAQAEHNALRPRLEDDVEAARQEENEADRIVIEKRADLDHAKQQLEVVQNRQGAQDTAYHPKMAQILQAIKNETRFKKPPIGPVGKHIKLLRPEWWSILEKSFGGTLNGFIVTNKNDQNLLSRITKTLRIDNIPIMISNEQPLDTTPYEPDVQFNTILRSLEIDNDAVRKILIIQHQIENTVLIPDQEEASRVLFRANPRPRNVRRCFCFQGNNTSRGFMLHFRGDKPAQDPLAGYSGMSRMKTNLDAQLRVQNLAVQDAQSRLEEAEQFFQDAQAKSERLNEVLTEHNDREQDLRLAFQEAEDLVEKLNDDIKNDSIESGKLEVLREALSDAETQKTVHEESFMDSQNALDERTKALRVATSFLNEFDKKISEHEVLVRSAQKAAQDAAKKRMQELGEKNSADARLKDVQRDCDETQRRMNDHDQVIAQCIEQAERVSQRVNIPQGDTFESLQKRYKRLKEDYERSQKQIGASREEVEAAAAQATEEYNRAKQDLVNMEELLLRLRETLNDRQKRWQLFRSFTSSHAKAQFTYLLSQRSFRGKLLADHKKKLLELSVEPDITKRDGSGRGARTLSGGEKSFTQICLLLAIWEAMGSPIRCLDEFDVFMDAVNRTMSVNLLIEAARQSPGRQYILISPGTKNDIKKGPDINAQEIAQPERGQTRLVLAPS